jgi:nicotinate phosphoribosyltransferase
MTASLSNSQPRLASGDALLIVDVQNDFLPGGGLAVPDGNAVVPILNRYLDNFSKQCLPILITRDWHPGNHCSFKKQGGPWPEHCVAQTFGAKFPAALNLPESAQIISKATHPDQDAYSGFQDTDLDHRLKSQGVRRLFIGGLATDYCVLNTVKDALKSGYTVFLLQDAVRAVNLNPGDGEKALQEMVDLDCYLCKWNDLRPRATPSATLNTDLYQLTMMQGYFDQDMNDIAIFEFYVRELPPGRGFLLAAGLEQVLDYLENLRFASQDLEWMRDSGFFSEKFIDSLAGFQFTGDVHAMPEGSVFFPNEPILRITAPLPQAQLVETRIINILQFQVMIASKAARIVLAGPGKTLIDFGLRRSHGAEAGLFAARASYIAGFTGTATVSAGALWDIPLFGTMAHSFIQAHDDETQAFENFAHSHPDNVIFLLDTYNNENAAHKIVDLAPRLKQEGINIRGVRLDSGDLQNHARKVRKILNAGGLEKVKIFASGDLDEIRLRDFESCKAPIDGYGIGTRLTTSADAPMLNCAYKLQEYAGIPRRKLSEGKSTLPGCKQVYRNFSEDHKMTGDTLALDREDVEGEPLGKPLIKACMRQGERCGPAIPLNEIREHAAQELDRLPEPLRSLKHDFSYPVEISDSLKKLAESLAKKLK